MYSGIKVGRTIFYVLSVILLLCYTLHQEWIPHKSDFPGWET